LDCNRRGAGDVATASILPFVAEVVLARGLVLAMWVRQRFFSSRRRQQPSKCLRAAVRLAPVGGEQGTEIVAVPLPVSFFSSATPGYGVFSFFRQHQVSKIIILIIGQIF
jgi:hypothetical protein